jgi:DNA ligase D-like protein (predicted 3'-phosphoesterase)
VFVLHEHHLPQHHFDLRLEEDGVLRSWAVPKGMPTDPAHNRLAVPVDDHELAHATYEDATKRIADNGWCELEDRDERRVVFVLHGREGPRRYALISTGTDALLHLVREQPDANGTSSSRAVWLVPKSTLGGTAVEGVLGRPVDLIAERLQEAAELLADGWSEESGLSGALAANCAANCR